MLSLEEGKYNQLVKLSVRAGILIWSIGVGGGVCGCRALCRRPAHQCDGLQC